MTKEFYCSKCQENVVCELEEVVIGDQVAGKTYFCPTCGREFTNEPDPDAVYDQMRDDEMFAKEEKC